MLRQSWKQYPAYKKLDALFVAVNFFPSTYPGVYSHTCSTNTTTDLFCSSGDYGFNSTSPGKQVMHIHTNLLITFDGESGQDKSSFLLFLCVRTMARGYCKPSSEEFASFFFYFAENDAKWVWEKLKIKNSFRPIPGKAISCLMFGFVQLELNLKNVSPNE